MKCDFSFGIWYSVLILKIQRGDLSMSNEYVYKIDYTDGTSRELVATHHGVKGRRLTDKKFYLYNGEELVAEALDAYIKGWARKSKITNIHLKEPSSRKGRMPGSVSFAFKDSEGNTVALNGTYAALEDLTKKLVKIVEANAKGKPIE